MLTSPWKYLYFPSALQSIHGERQPSWSREPFSTVSCGSERNWRGYCGHLSHTDTCHSKVQYFMETFGNGLPIIFLTSDIGWHDSKGGIFHIAPPSWCKKRRAFLVYLRLLCQKIQINVVAFLSFPEQYSITACIALCCVKYYEMFRDGLMCMEGYVCRLLQILLFYIRGLNTHSYWYPWWRRWGWVSPGANLLTFNDI